MSYGYAIHNNVFQKEQTGTYIIFDEFHAKTPEVLACDMMLKSYSHKFKTIYSTATPELELVRI